MSTKRKVKNGMNLQRTEPISSSLERGSPWTVWRVWSPWIYQAMERFRHDDGHDHDHDDSLSNVDGTGTGMIHRVLEPLGLPNGLEGLFFEVVSGPKFGRSDCDDVKVVVNVTALGSEGQGQDLSERSENHWLLTANGDFAEVLLDILRVDDVLIIWGGAIDEEQKTVVLNAGPFATKSYMAMYRHDEMSPLKNMHEQFHIPFHARDVDYAYHVLSEFEDTIVLKICSAIYTGAPQVEYTIPELDNIGLDQLSIDRNVRSSDSTPRTGNNGNENRKPERKFFSARRKLSFTPEPLGTTNTASKRRWNVKFNPNAGFKSKSRANESNDVASHMRCAAANHQRFDDPEA